MHYSTIIFIHRAAFGFIHHFARLFLEDSTLLLLLDVTDMLLNHTATMLTFRNWKAFFTQRVRRSDNFTRRRVLDADNSREKEHNLNYFALKFL